MALSIGNLIFAGTVIISCFVASQCWRLLLVSSRKPVYPPGPPARNWITGHASDLTSGKIWETYTEWAKTYGKIISLRVFGDRIVVLNSLDLANELLEKRSNIYSDRPDITMVNMMDWDFTTAFKPYGAEWRAHRRLMQQSFKPDASRDFRPTQTRKMNNMLLGLLTDPENFSDHIKTLAAAISMSAIYGHDISPKNDYFVTLAQAALLKLTQSAFPAAALVNALRFLRFLPVWFPGASFKRFAFVTKDLVAQMQEVPYNHVKKSLAAGAVSSSWVGHRLDSCQSEYEHRMLREAAASIYAAGADTVVTTLTTFFYAMTIFPDAQKKAQQELDTVVGTERLVDYEDFDSLPYIQAMVREIFRWKPVLPLCIAHATSDEDIYENYYIPRGATVVPNVWAMTRDPVKYKDPELFNPDRFFDPKTGNLNDDDVRYTFGFGRRVCPGRHMGTATVWLAVATVLSMFDVEKKKDLSGKQLPLNVEYSNDLISHPLHFECAIKPRSPNVREIIMDVNRKM